MIKPLASTALAFVLLLGVAAGTATAAPTYGLSSGAYSTNPFSAEDR